MSKKRRMFDIDIPDEGAEAPKPTGQTFPAGKVSRRGPMASAIQETAESSRSRAEVEAAIRAENDALAQEHVRLKRAGLITQLIPVDAIDTLKLCRDRLPAADDRLPELMTSIRDVGLSNPIQVEPAEGGRYELIQGFRRLSAFKALLEETGDAERWGHIPAGIMADEQGLETLYRRMVDENAVRKDISFFEMAALAVQYALDPVTQERDAEKAVKVLFQSSSYQKRSYIRAFIPLVEAFEGVLDFPHEIPRALGLKLAKRLEESDEVAAAIRAELAELGHRGIEQELDVLRSYAGEGDARKKAAKPRPSTAGNTKTTLVLNRPRGQVKCVAADGKLEIRMDRDFAGMDRQQLEHAVKCLLDQLG